MTATNDTSQQALRIELSFPNSVYSGASPGTAEEVPSHARVHEAFVAAAAGGPWGEVDGRVLIASPDHRCALVWLEEHEPLAIAMPRTRVTVRGSRRYRWRGSPVTAADTPFEPMVALDGPVVYLWPCAPDGVVDALVTIAQEVTHVGRADSVAIVRVAQGMVPRADVLWTASGRGPGSILRIPAKGRMAELERAHAQATAPGPHSRGKTGRQAPDLLVTGANETGTELRRFAESDPSRWPYSEVWRLPIRDVQRPVAEALADRRNRVPAALGIHRALIRAIDRSGSEVPDFVTGRGLVGPLRTAGHLAIHVAEGDSAGGFEVLLAIPGDVAPADRELLLLAIGEGKLRAGIVVPNRRPVHWFSIGAGTIGPAVPFWGGASGNVQRSTVPIVLEAAGGPRRGSWSVDDSTMCSLGYAMRSVLEQDGFEWGKGWAFRQRLVAALRGDYSVQVHARRVRSSASRYGHRASPGELLVAVDAAVDFGDLAPQSGGLLALGRARHLGGGLLRPEGHDRS